jgi:branched-chain amino acid transport system ATP-binding protein
VQGVDLAVGAGEVVGVFGRNGVGKTTLLKTIAGWIRASRGEIRFDGMRIDGAAPDRICRLGVGFVPEDRRIFPGLTVEENLTLGFMQVPRRGGAANRAALADIYRRFPRLHERRRQHGTTLSGGEQQMLAVARALMLRPRLMLLDEPSFGLAPLIVRELFKILGKINREDKVTILVVEQNAQLALELADQAYVIETGKIVMSGNAKDIATNEDVRKSYLGY